MHTIAIKLHKNKLKSDGRSTFHKKLHKSIMRFKEEYKSLASTEGPENIKILINKKDFSENIDIILNLILENEYSSSIKEISGLLDHDDLNQLYELINLSSSLLSPKHRKHRIDLSKIIIKLPNLEQSIQNFLETSSEDIELTKKDLLKIKSCRKLLNNIIEESKSFGFSFIIEEDNILNESELINFFDFQHKSIEEQHREFTFDDSATTEFLDPYAYFDEMPDTPLSTSIGSVTRPRFSSDFSFEELE